MTHSPYELRIGDHQFRVEHYGVLGWEIVVYEVLPDDRGMGERVAYVQRMTRRGAMYAAKKAIA